MDWFCCGSHRLSTANQVKAPPFSSDAIEPITTDRTNNDSDDRTIMVQEFTFQELADATQNFSLECLVGEGFYGIVYKGKLRETGEIVAVRRLDSNNLKGQREFLAHMSTLGNLHHPNLINLRGYGIADYKRIFLVHEYMPLGSLYQHLHDKQKPPLDWYPRMKIALEIAKGLEWLHHASLIYGNMKSTNVLLDNDFNAKLSDFGIQHLATYAGDCRLGMIDVDPNNGYRAPQYILIDRDHMTVKADVYSFGVVLLELITGKRACWVDNTTRRKTYLVDWAEKKLKKPKKFPELADPVLEGKFPAEGFNQVLAVAAKCIRLRERDRPMMSDVVAAIMWLTSENLNDKLV